MFNFITLLGEYWVIIAFVMSMAIILSYVFISLIKCINDPQHTIVTQTVAAIALIFIVIKIVFFDKKTTLHGRNKTK